MGLATRVECQAMRFYLTIFLVAILYIRPGELIVGLENIPVYQTVILTCMACSAVPLLRQLTPNGLAASPVTLCVLGLLLALAISHLSRFKLGDAYYWVVTVLKLFILYLVVVANLDSYGRLRQFFGWLGGLILALAVLALLQYHEAISIPTLEPLKQNELDPTTGELVGAYPRLCGPGIFNDPNDLCVTLVMGVMISVYWLGERHLGATRFFWLGSLVVMGYAISLTHSRGGFLALLLSCVTLLLARWGGKKALLLSLFLVPVLLVALSGRQTRFDFSDKTDTGQQRLRIWSEGLLLLRGDPIFGVGQGRFVEEVGITAHNTFVEAFTETGLVGGTFFLGAFTYALMTLARVGTHHSPPFDRRLRYLQPYILAVVAGLVGGMLSISRGINPPTYVVLGLVTAYLRLAAASTPGLVPRLTVGMTVRMATLSVVFLLATYTFTILVVRWE